MTPFPVEPARSMGPMRLVLSAYPNREAALAAVEGALARRLAACASTFPVDSRYWWNGGLESAAESVVLFKTVPKRVGGLFRFLKENHPYDVPEIVEIDVPRADAGYLAYLGRTLDAHALNVPPRPPARRSAGPRARAARAPGRTRAPHHRPSR
ncbi:MAG TPA: divalent cation tolerance protein CutA [Thermoplasmata archaeon]|nr:divalent cation tolerance protein CutA [Thermoplasmata archaeon]